MRNLGIHNNGHPATGRTMRIALALILVAGLFLAIAGIASAQDEWPQPCTSQVWFLHDQGHPVNDGLIMEKIQWGQTGEVDIPAGQCRIWLSDEAAITNVTFLNGVWIIGLNTDSEWGTGASLCNAIVGQWDIMENRFVPFSTEASEKSWDPTLHELIVKVKEGSETILKDNYLALQICNDDSIAHKVYTNKHSGLQSPCSDPGFPTPEVATGILLGLGIVGLIGYSRFNKWATTQK
jgi:hypothetical protein